VKNTPEIKGIPELKGTSDVKISSDPKKSIVLINIDKEKQEMTVSIDGVQTYDWPVSTGRAGYSTPSGSYTATSMNEIWYSRQWDNAPMPHAIFFMKDGHAIHATLDVKNLGKPASHGCVRISPANATTLFALVKANGLENTQVVLGGVTPGGEYKGAGPATARYIQANPAGYETGYAYYSQSYAQPQARVYYAQPQARAYTAQPQPRGYYTQSQASPRPAQYYAAPQGYAPQGYYVAPWPYAQQ
jgi:L,D-transpeptidase catalytic domain